MTRSQWLLLGAIGLGLAIVMYVVFLCPVDWQVKAEVNGDCRYVNLRHPSAPQSPRRQQDDHRAWGLTIDSVGMCRWWSTSRAGAQTSNRTVCVSLRMDCAGRS